MASDRRVWAVIPAAGTSDRYLVRGYMTPKPLLRVRSRGVTKTMLEHVLDCVPSEYRRMVVLPLGCEVPPVSAEVLLVQSTSGQAETVMRAVRSLSYQDVVVTLDCDTIVQPGDVRATVRAVTQDSISHNKAVAAFMVGESSDPEMSHVDSLNAPTVFGERSVVGTHGVVSGRAFYSAGALASVLDTVVEECRGTSVAPDMSMLLSRLQGRKHAHVVTEWQDWGTPEKLYECGAEIML